MVRKFKPQKTIIMKQQKEKASWLFYQSWEESVSLLNLEERGQLLTNLIAYHKDEPIELNTPMLTMFWNSIKFNLDRNIANYKTKCQNGSLGGAPKGNTNAKKQSNNNLNSTENNLNSTEFNLNDNDNDNDNVDDSVNVDDNNNENSNENSNVDVNVNYNRSVEVNKFFAEEIEK